MHYCTAFLKRLQITRKQTNTFEFELTSNHWYPQDVVKNSGKNKVIGRTYGFGVHNNSIRVVYKPSKEKNKFKLWWYWYDAGQRNERYIGQFEMGKYRVVFCKKTNMVNCYLKNALMQHQAPYSHYIKIKFKNELKKYGTYCFPFFGGQDRAYKTFVWHVLFD